MAVSMFTHVGIAVTNLDTSRRFFIEGLDFEPVRDANGTPFQYRADENMYGETVGHLLEFDSPVVVNLAGLERDGKTIELVEYESPPAERHGRRPSNICGFTHMYFIVDDVDETAAKLEQLGGTILHHTKVTSDEPDGVERDYMLCLDPDGAVKIELVRSGVMPTSMADA